MAVDLSPIDESLLAEIANMHGMPKGAFNVRKDGELVERKKKIEGNAAQAVQHMIDHCEGILV